MARKGFTCRAAPVAPAGETDIPRPRPFGVETLDSPKAEASESLPPEQPHGEAFARALLGDPDDKVSVKGRFVDVSQPLTGCQAEAGTRLLGDGRQKWLTLRLRLDEGEKDALGRLEGDRAFRTLDARRRTCLADAGFKAATPAGLVTSLPPGPTCAATPPSGRTFAARRVRTVCGPPTPGSPRCSSGGWTPTPTSSPAVRRCSSGSTAADRVLGA